MLVKDYDYDSIVEHSTIRETPYLIVLVSVMYSTEQYY